MTEIVKAATAARPSKPQSGGERFPFVVAVLRELQRRAGAKAFYLAERALEPYGVPKSSLATLLRGLCRDGMLRRVREAGYHGRRAAEYRWLEG